MLKGIIYLLLLLPCLLAPAYAENKLDLTPEEWRWVKQHPDISYSVKDVWPQEYRDAGQHRGLSRDFLDSIERQTGLRFTFIPPDAGTQPMMISSVNGSLLTAEEKQGWLFTSAWMSAIPMMVARNDATHNRNLEQMAGRTLAVIGGGEYANWLRLHHPNITLVIERSAAGAMEAVKQGKADAAIGSGLIMLPVYQRQFSDSLAITSQAPEMASSINMAVSDRYPVLLSVLNKALANMSAKEVQDAYIAWFGIVEVGTPTFGVLLYHYWQQILLFGVLLALLIWALRQAQRAKKRAEKSEADKSAFLALMSHEIRTPMNALVAALELLSYTGDPKKRREYTRLAVSSSQNLLELLNNVLDHEKLSLGQQELALSTVELSPLLEAIAESQRPAAEQKGLTLKLDLAPGLYGQWVKVDAHRLQQVINNLLSNALKFTAQGEVTLAASLDKHLTISVSDTGIGLSPESQKRLFTAWQQADQTTARRYGGSGLGLYISHQLVTLMQGTFSLQSEPGAGSTFSFSIPLEHSDIPPTMSEASAPLLPQFGQRLSLLVVEDHPANRQVISGQLDALQCHYQMAIDGEQALQWLEDENYYDAILLDCNLPGRDGYQVAREIRAIELAGERERIPVIAISALNSAEHRQRCRESDMDDVLTKPIRLRALAEMLAKWCPESVEQNPPGAEPEPVRQPQLFNWLLLDAADFARAAETQDRRYLIHAIHRIKGVAQMYQLPELEAFSADVELVLRGEGGLNDLPLSRWAARLEALIRQAEKA